MCACVCVGGPTAAGHSGGGAEGAPSRHPVSGAVCGGQGAVV